MLTVQLRFPGGRYHATPWGHHVNEGLVEWPPSPWRLLRAFIAVWHRKCPELPESTVEALVNRLSTNLPRYRLPPAVLSHTRHYMPLGSLDGAYEKTGKVLDAFVQLSKAEPLIVEWPVVELDKGLRDALRLILKRMTYLGRAESWVEATLVETSLGDDSMRVGEDWAVPVDAKATLGEREHTVKLMAPVAPAVLEGWRPRVIEELLQLALEQKRQTARAKGKDESKVKLSARERSAIDNDLPSSVLQALHADTSELQKQGWSAAPATEWVQYCLPDAVGPSRVPVNSTQEHVATVARFALASAVPPRLTSALHFAEKVRSALMSLSDGHPVFSGKKEDGSPATGNQHAFILPEPHGRHGRISHVTLCAPMGFDSSARGALKRLRKLRGKGGHDVQLVLLGVGGPADFAGMNSEAGQCPLVVRSERWVSLTPFVPTRHAHFTKTGQPKLDATGVQIGSPEHDLRRLIGRQDLPNPVSVEAVSSVVLGGKRTPWSAFQTVRHKGGGVRSSSGGCGFAVTFDRPVRGPIALGYGAHFGLGVFVPAPTGT